MGIYIFDSENTEGEGVQISLLGQGTVGKWISRILEMV